MRNEQARRRVFLLCRRLARLPLPLPLARYAALRTLRLRLQISTYV